MWKLSHCRAGKRERGFPNAAVVNQQSLSKYYCTRGRGICSSRYHCCYKALVKTREGVEVSLIPKRVSASSFFSCMDCCLEALVFANSDAPPFCFIKRRTVSAPFPWQNPRSTADNTKILELSICYLRCMRAPWYTEVLSLSLFYGPAP